jgi:hypothetical protein
MQQEPHQTGPGLSTAALLHVHVVVHCGTPSAWVTATSWANRSCAWAGELQMVARQHL